MSGLGADAAPFAVNRTIGVFDGVERILDKLIHLVHRHVLFV